MALSTITEEFEPEEPGVLSHVSSVTTVIHFSDDEDAGSRERRTVLSGLARYDPFEGLPNETLGRLSFCIFDMRRPTKRWYRMLEREDLRGAFFYALDYYTRKKPGYRFIYQNVHLWQAPATPERYSVWIRSVCKYVLKELREQHILKVNARRSGCEPR